MWGKFLKFIFITFHVSQAFSKYKSRSTVKYFVGIIVTGAVSFLSAGWEH